MESKYDYVVFDSETTGLHPDSDQICEIAAIGVKDGLPQGLFSTLVAIEGSMPEAAGRVNGITDDMLKGAPAIGDALDAFLDFIEEDAVLAGHNIASFDIPFMEAAAAKSGRDFTYLDVIDTLEAARELWPDLPSRSMDSLRDILGIERTDAVEDATTCFPRTEDGVPFCWDYQIKGFFKDACSSLRRVPGTRSSKLTAFKKVIDGTVFVEQRKIPFRLPEGAQCGRCERPLRASSASGERVALAASETVPAGTVLEFSILVMNPKDAETVREWLDYGRLRGLFQWRNSGKGRFEWEEVA